MMPEPRSRQSTTTSLNFVAPPVRARPARRIRDDAEAIAVVEEIAAKLAEGAAARDRERILPYEEMELISDAGLLAITVPKAYGGAGVRAGTVARVIAALSRRRRLDRSDPAKSLLHA